MKYRLDMVRCPACEDAGDLREISGALVCRTCAAAYPMIGGIPNLITDPSLKTALENIDYDAVHGLSQGAREKTYLSWEELFQTLSIQNGKVLEIGSGTGNLTWGLMHRSGFDEVYATDLSAKFLNHVETQFGKGAKNRTYYCICDANDLPFRENRFDVVVGHSVLHHLFHYKRTLASVRRILTAGGVAIFFEPVLQGKIYVSFLIDMMQRIDRSFGLDILSDEDRRKITQQVRQHTKDAFIKGNEKILKSIEDKYIFDAVQLGALYSELGFSRFQIRPNRTLDRSYRSYVAFQCSLLGIGADKVKRFNDVFGAFEGTIGLMLGEYLPSPMSFLIFHK